MAIKKAPFRPTASPVTTVGRPRTFQRGPGPVAPAKPAAPEGAVYRPKPMPLEGRGMYQLGQAIAEFNPKAQQFVNDYFQQQQVQKSKEFYENFATMDEEEAQQYYQQQTETLDDRYRAALDRQYGYRQAYRDYNGIKADLQAGNINLENTSLEDVLSEKMQASLDGGPSQWFGEGYKAIMREAVPSVRQVEQEFRAQQLRSEADNNAFQLANDAIQQGVDTATDPAAIYGTVRSVLKTEFGPGTDINMSNSRLDDITLDVASYWADQGREDVVEAILDTPRQGDNGETIPALSSTRRNAERVDTIRRTAKGRQEERITEERFGWLVDHITRANRGELSDSWFEENQQALQDAGFSPNAVASLMDRNRRAREAELGALQAEQLDQEARNAFTPQLTDITGQVINDPSLFGSIEGLSVTLSNGQEASLTKSETESLILENVRSHFGIVPNEETGRFDPLSPEGRDAMSDYANWLSSSGYVDERLKRQLRTAPSSYTMENAANGNVPRQLAESYQIFKDIRGNGGLGLLTDSYITEDQAAFYRTVQRLEDDGGYEVEQAIQMAARGRMNGSPDLTKLSKPPRDELNNYVNDLVGGLNQRFDGEGDALNRNLLSARLEGLAETYMTTMGLATDEAYSAAVEDLTESLTVVDGVAMNARKLPGSEEEFRSVTTFLQEQFVANGFADGLGYDAEDIRVAPITYDGQTGYMIVGPNMEPIASATEDVEFDLGGGETITMKAGVFSADEFQNLSRAQQAAAIRIAEQDRQQAIRDDQSSVSIGEAADDLAGMAGFEGGVVGGQDSDALIEVGPIQPENIPGGEAAAAAGRMAIENADPQAAQTNLDAAGETIESMDQMMRAGSTDTNVNFLRGKSDDGLIAMYEYMQQQPMEGDGPGRQLLEQAEAEIVRRGLQVPEAPKSGDKETQSAPASVDIPSGDQAAFSVPGLNIERRFSEDFHYGRQATANAQDFQGIVMHWTSEGTSAQQIADYGNRDDPGRGGAFGYHFVIGSDGKIIQAAPMNKRTNHILPDEEGVNLSNRNAIGISLAGAAGGATPEQEAAARRLARQLMEQYGIDASNVLGHGEIQSNRQAQEGALAAAIREMRNS